jgi:hypothetical protein
VDDRGDDVSAGEKRPWAVNPSDADKALSIAAENWRDWSDVFGHIGPAMDNPILTSRVHFGCFLWEYNVGRTIKSADARRLQRALREDESFQAAVMNDDEERLADAVRRHSMNFSAKRSDGGLRSLLSKVAAFCNPGAFIAWDRFARRGLSRLIHGKDSRFESSLPDYQRAARSAAAGDTILADGSAEKIVAKANEVGAPIPAFRLRVLDAAAMEVGRREAYHPRRTGRSD